MSDVQPHELDLDARYQRYPHCAWSRLDDDVLILDTERRKTHRLPDPAGFLWERLTMGASLRELLLEVSAAYDVGPEAAESNVRETLARLLREGALVPLANQSS